jgi:NADH dehydrogenase [ubiquinone] 1 alpha subcomplex assembly factor 1
MKFIVLFSILLNPILLFDFSKKSDLSNWEVVNDGVMGGVSSSDFFIDTKGNGTFKGFVSIDNNGGFCSVRHFFKPLKLSDKSIFKIRLKGDGKKYQFRVKKNQKDYYSYIYEFQTSTEWETIEIPVNKLYASFRGRTLQLPNYEGQNLEEIAFLIGNKKNENFELLIDSITVQ